MKLTLHWTEGETGQRVEITADLPIIIGREKDCAVVLTGEKISRHHAEIRLTDGQVQLQDRGSTNGTFVNGERVAQTDLQSGDIVQIGDFSISVLFMEEEVVSTDNQDVDSPLPQTVFDDNASPLPPTSLPSALKGTLVFNGDESELAPFISDASPVTPEQFPPAAFAQEFVSVDELRSLNIPIEETTYLALGGGLGSYIWVDNLLIYGVKPDHIVSIGLEEVPYARYARLCRNSQIPSHERLRSNSDSCPDNIWGWPGYAVREMWGSLKRFELGNFFRVGWSIFNEPVLGQVYTPRAGDVFKSIDREARRIGWNGIWRYGRIKAIRKTDDGRYAVAYSQTSEAEGQVHTLMIGRFVQLAVGYPGVRFLPDLQEFREKNRDFEHVVNTYENHEHVYNELKENGGTVLLRGRGIVASRIIQRINELRVHRKDINVLHLMRTPLSEGRRYKRARRAIDNHWEFQPYNWPKAAWGGDLREALENGDFDTRAQLYKDWGGTTTASRKDWQAIIEKGLSEGWYQINFGNVMGVTRNEDGKLVTMIEAQGGFDSETSLVANFILDCTGLEADLSASPLLQDLVTHYQLGANTMGRLDVENDFEVRGMANTRGRMYACGAMTLGGPYAGVDSFLGLQYSAQRTTDSLTRLRAPGLQKLNGFRSLGQWLRWARGVRP